MTARSVRFALAAAFALTSTRPLALVPFEESRLRFGDFGGTGLCGGDRLAEQAC